MDTMEQMKLFLLVILPALQCSTTASMFAASVVIPAVALQLESSFEHAAAMILALKYLFPHQHREYHSPFYHEPRSDDLWNNFMLAHWSDLKFKETFRVDKSSFQWLCQRLSPWLQGGHTNYKESLSVEKKVAIGLYRLAGEIIPYRIIGETFGVAGPTACKVFKQFIFAVIEVGRQCMGCCA